MFELGDESQKEHQAIANMIENKKWSGVFLVGKEFSNVKSSAKLFISTEDFMKWLSENPIKEATILLKGSRGMQMEKILEKL